MIVQKAREIRNAQIEFVSLVDRAANKKKFLITKSADNKADFLMSGRIIKADNTTHHITGIVYEPMTEDAHGDFMTEEEILKAAYWFAKNGDKVDRQHNFKSLPDATVVENWVTKSDTVIEGQTIKKGTWLITVEVNDPCIWESVQKGEITGFSMGGVGEYMKEEVQLETSNTQNGAPEKAGVLKKLACWLGVDSDEEDIQKAGRKISGKNYNTLRQISTNLNDFISGFSAEEEKEDLSMSQENFQEMVDAAVAKAMSKNETAMSAIEKMIDTAIDRVFNSSKQSAPAPAGVEKSAPAPAEQITPEAISKMVQDAIAKASAPKQESVSMEQVQKMITDAVEKAMEPIRKQAGIPTNLNDSGQIEKQENDHYLKGIL